MIIIKIYTEENLLDLVEEFSFKIIGGIETSLQKATLKEFAENPSTINHLRNKSGIYYFVQREEVNYVGRALPSVGLRSRIINQTTAFGDVKWDIVIKDNNTEVGVIVFEDPTQWYFISALEHYLIEKLERPAFNKRC